MFDVGMGEVGLIAVIALLVLGPERLPRAARTAGALLRKARQSWQSVQAEIERELAAEELKRHVKETVAAADPRADLQAAAQTVQDAVTGATSTDAPATPSATADHDERK